MTFRDDIDAAYARLETLESENRKLVEENAKLLCIVVPAKPRVPTSHEAVLARIEELERVNPRLAANNEKLRNGASVPLPPPKPSPGGGDFPNPSPEFMAGLFVIFAIVALIFKALL